MASSNADEETAISVQLAITDALVAHGLVETREETTSYNLLTMLYLYNWDQVKRTAPRCKGVGVAARLLPRMWAWPHAFTGVPTHLQQSGEC